MSRKNVESSCPDNIRIRVWHFRGEDVIHMCGRDGAWATVCRVYDADDVDFVAPLLEAWSHCHVKDQPNRKIGRKIAVGRAMKKFHTLNYVYSGDLDAVRLQFYKNYDGVQ